MLITFYGASDDLVEVSGCPGADEFNHYGNQPWRGDLIAPDGVAMRVHLAFDGCWHVGVGQTDEGLPLPQWPLSFTSGPDESRQYAPSYSAVLVVDAPDGTRMENVGTLR
ncbi:hypothetical protein BBK14_11410 [Parafrankia soli]|uniref:Uncharacterized protein n=1 Tax=Parafrankia soli TaxID=2599596 RepID=A0A1S1R8Z7_9ACTN|nr:hypothetical protein [Parafrankia soli]OHV42221.1 hypothetical protein BBK14_11410 [Parafrankia soli]